MGLAAPSLSQQVSEVQVLVPSWLRLRAGGGARGRGLEEQLNPEPEPGPSERGSGACPADC